MYSPAVATRPWPAVSAHSTVLSADEPGEELALLAARLASAYWFAGDLDRSQERAELALDIAEAQGFPEPLAIALRAKGAVGREPRSSRRGGRADQARSHDRARARPQPGDHRLVLHCSPIARFRQDRYVDALDYLDEALAFAQKMGSRPHEWGIWPSGHTPSSCSAAGTRSFPQVRSSPRSRSTPAGSC